MQKYKKKKTRRFHRFLNFGSVLGSQLRVVAEQLFFTTEKIAQSPLVLSEGSLDMVPCGDGAMQHCQQGTRIKWIQHSCPGTLSIAASYLFRVTITPGTVRATLCTVHTASSGQVMEAPLSLMETPPPLPLVWAFFIQTVYCRSRKDILVYLT